MFLKNVLRRSVRDAIETSSEAARARRIRDRRNPLGLEPLEGRQLLTTLFVTNLSDASSNPSKGSLRYEMWRAEPGDTIQFSSSLKGTIPLVSTLEPGVSGLTIQGVSAGTVPNITIQGRGTAGTYSAFKVFDGIELTIKNLSVSKFNSSSAASGAAFSVLSGGTLTLQNDQVVSNSMKDTARAGGIIYNAGTLRLSNDTFSNNFVTDTGSVYCCFGAIYNEGGTVTLSNNTFSNNTNMNGNGSAIFNHAGSVISNQDTFSKNSASYGGAVFNAGVLNSKNDTFSSNWSVEGGAIYNYSTGRLTLTNTSVIGNRAQHFKGLNDTGFGGGIYNAGTSTLLSCSIQGNGADSSGGGFYNAAGSTLEIDVDAGAILTYWGRNSAGKYKNLANYGLGPKSF